MYTEGEGDIKSENERYVTYTRYDTHTIDKQYGLPTARRAECRRPNPYHAVAL